MINKNHDILNKYLPNSTYNTRNQDSFQYPIHNLKITKKFTLNMGLKMYYKIPNHFKQLHPAKFSWKIKKILTKKAYYTLKKS